MLAKLSFRTRDPADARMMFPPRVKHIPGNGKVSRVQTSASDCSRRTLSDLFGANTITRCVVNNDCDRLIATAAEGFVTWPSCGLWVFLMITWQGPPRVPTVAALWMESCLASVPPCPKTGNSAFSPKDVAVTRLGTNSCVAGPSRAKRLLPRSIPANHCCCSVEEQALNMSSKRWLSDSNMIFHEKRTVWHCKP